MLTPPWPTRIACSRCGAEMEGVVVDSINAERFPELRAAVLDRSLHHLRCAQCGTRHALDKELLYVDFARAQWVTVFPVEELPRFAECEETARRAFAHAFVDTAPGFVRATAARFAVRVTFGLEGLREKLVCWDAGLDDRVLELLKIDLVADRPELVARGVGSFTLDAVAPDGMLLFVPMLRVPNADPAVHVVVGMPRAVYDEAARASDGLRAAHEALWSGPFVSVARYWPYSDA